MVPHHHGKSTTGSDRGRGSPRRGGQTLAPGRPLELLGAVSPLDRPSTVDVSGATTWSVLLPDAGSVTRRQTHLGMYCSGAQRWRDVACGTINPEATDVRDDGVVAALTAGFRTQLSLLGYAP